MVSSRWTAGGEGSQLGRDRVGEFVHRLVEVVNMREDAAHEERVMGPKPASEGRPQGPAAWPGVGAEPGRPAAPARSCPGRAPPTLRGPTRRGCRSRLKPT